MDEKTVAKQKVSIGAKIISVLYFIAAAWFSLFAVASFGLGYDASTPDSITIIKFVSTALGIVALLVSVGIGLWKGKSWARTTAIIISGLALIGPILAVTERMGITHILQKDPLLLQDNPLWRFVARGYKTIIFDCLVALTGAYLFFSQRTKKVKKV
ncbi:MAG: hypothetical protein Q7S65_02870 [Nanoarchaeota archaeon]|nr:hypothetical protein [Nanoarchaeota archaeon]